MKIAIVGSRDVTVFDIGRYISNAEEIVSGRWMIRFCCYRWDHKIKKKEKRINNKE